MQLSGLVGVVKAHDKAPRAVASMVIHASVIACAMHLVSMKAAVRGRMHSLVRKLGTCASQCHFQACSIEDLVSFHCMAYSLLMPSHAIT